jgi:hypothetical protein
MSFKGVELEIRVTWADGEKHPVRVRYTDWVELEIRVPCANGEEHPVRVRYTDWDAISCEVIYNPCQEKAHDSPDSPPPCIKMLQDKQVYIELSRYSSKFTVKSIYGVLWENPTHRLALLRGFLEEKAPAAAQMLLKALEDPDPTIAFTAAEFLGNFPDDPTISEALVEKIISILRSLYEFKHGKPRGEIGYITSSDPRRPVPKRPDPAWEESSLRVTFEAAASALVYVGIPDRFLQAKLRAAIHQLIAPYGEVYFRARYKEYNLNASIDPEDIDALIMMERVLSVLRSVLSVVGSLGDVPVFAAAGMPMEEEARLGNLAKHWHKLSEEQRLQAMEAMRAFKIFWWRWHLLNQP